VAIKNAVRVAAEMVRNKVNGHIQRLLDESDHAGLALGRNDEDDLEATEPAA
jgi:hypothetical protein